MEVKPVKNAATTSAKPAKTNTRPATKDTLKPVAVAAKRTEVKATPSSKSQGKATKTSTARKPGKHVLKPAKGKPAVAGKRPAKTANKKAAAKLGGKPEKRLRKN